ncbi:twin-arginine translocase TatA/TatE family subunit [Roseiflexus sp. RS-1]|jgi:sec-independent protein translocase protein TatB|uniref:twin-arginine translocase TatA/TatE family subunit n=1 Tax=Roseiflexus sp. (strain RS-1) TaxID=357808 RepID=UPI0000D81592|nr:twin-arginine translocase TatA/TatE family subunit [Roseiflexus sp. RS-1]ABQ89392.1 sec-independent translocation protein mttA/Hcf106 [Roseiflexus sp. RS-1]
MELLGVGPGEILLILVIMLLVFGPERLPEFARQAGLFVVRVRDWIQRSPDAALVLRARAELESELQAIRAELTREVESVRQDLQSVRSDLADAGKLVEQSAQDAAAVSKIELPDTTAQSTDTPSIAPPAPEVNAPVSAPPVQEPASAVLPEFDVDPGPIGARRARIAEVAEARQAATPPPAPTIAGGETVARGARIEPPAQPARVVTDDSPFAADMARIDDLSRQVASIAEELARLRVILLQRMAEEKRHQAHIDSVSPGETVALNGARDAETLHNGAVSSNDEQALPDDTPAPPRGVEALP